MCVNIGAYADVDSNVGVYVIMYVDVDSNVGVYVIIVWTPNMDCGCCFLWCSCCSCVFMCCHACACVFTWFAYEYDRR